MKKATGDLPRYLRQVKAACPPALRRRLMTDLENSVADFLEEHPGSTAADLVQQFGAPQQFAAEHMAAMEDGERMALYKKYRRRVMLSLIAGSILVLLIVGFCIYVVAESSSGPVTIYSQVTYT